MTLGSFKVTLICTINCFIIYFIIQNAVIQEINNGIINALFLVNSLKGSFFVECPLCFSFCFLWSFIWNQSKLCFVFCYVLSLPCTKMTHQSPIACHAPHLLVLHLLHLSVLTPCPLTSSSSCCTSNSAADDMQIAHSLLAHTLPQQLLFQCHT